MDMYNDAVKYQDRDPSLRAGPRGRHGIGISSNVESTQDQHNKETCFVGDASSARLGRRLCPRDGSGLNVVIHAERIRGIVLALQSDRSLDRRPPAQMHLLRRRRS